MFSSLKWVKDHTPRLSSPGPLKALLKQLYRNRGSYWEGCLWILPSTSLVAEVGCTWLRTARLQLRKSLVLNHVILINEGRKFNIYSCKVSFSLALFPRLLPAPALLVPCHFPGPLVSCSFCSSACPSSGTCPAPELSSQVPPHTQDTAYGRISFLLGLSFIL